MCLYSGPCNDDHCLVELSTISGLWQIEHSHQALILSQGRLYLYSGKNNELSPVSSTAELVITSVHPIQAQEVLVVTEGGRLYRCDLSQSDVQPQTVPPDCQAAVASRHHTALIDGAGRLWSCGRPPQVGTVTETQAFTRLSLTGSEVVQLVAGQDFTAALVRRRKAPDGLRLVPDTPDTPDTPDGQTEEREEGPVCPLGLALKGEISPTAKANNNAQKQDTDHIKKDNEDISSNDETDSKPDNILSVNTKLALTSPVTHMMSQVTSQVTSLGRSVWTNSLSVLSTSAQLQPEAQQDPDLDSSSASFTSSRSPSLKSRSEPPDLDQPRRGHRRSVSVAGSVEGGEGEAVRVEGERLCSAEVWTWGGGRRGQLGLGDMLVRNNPSPVRLSGQVVSHVTRLSAGLLHLLAMTDCGSVWGWGDNTQGQASYTDHLGAVITPALVPLQPGEMARDINCSGHTSAILTSLSRCYILGSWRGERLTRLQVVDISLPDLVPSAVWLSEDGVMVRCKEGEDRTADSLSLLEQNILTTLSQVVAVLDKALKPQILHSEQPELERVRQMVVTVYHVVTGAREGRQQTGVLGHTKSVTGALSRLSVAVGDCIAADSLLLDNVNQTLTPSIVSILQLNLNLPQADIQGQAVLEQLLSLTTTELLSPYLASLQSVQSSTNPPPRTKQKIFQLSQHQVKVRSELQLARDTRTFWQSAGPRFAALMTSTRRVVLDSRKDLATLEGRYTKHWLVLLSDCLIDAGYNTVTQYDLETVWCELTNTARAHQLTVTTPEEVLTLSFPDLSARTVWSQALNKCIITTLKSGERSGDGSWVSAPVTRWAKYSWTRGELKGCKYEGSWLEGKIHGRGKMVYSDKSHHQGLWRDGKRHGRGLWTGSGGELMEGTWVRGSLVGRGKLVDGNGNVYTGDIADGLPHGHGVMKEGRFMDSGANIYIGSWVKGVKNGYGVMDDIHQGEKYLGMWESGAKNGPGCVVNSDSVYYEGTFSNNKLVGCGLMLFEDGARYEGEFSGAGEFNGRGTLYSGNRKMVGTFHGNYSDSMKFSGEIRTISPDEVTGRDSGNLIEPSNKWWDIFSEWDRTVNNNSEPGPTDTAKVWENIAILMSKAKADNPDESLLDSLETIPTFGQLSPLLYSDVEDIENYLAEAFQAPLHPLHLIFSQLVEAFISSYGGVRSHSTLLPHAKQELSSIICRLYSLLLSLFPALPPTSSGSVSPLCLLSPSGEEKYVTPTSILHPALLPKLHPTIFMLYALR